MTPPTASRPTIVAWLGYGGLLPFVGTALALALDPHDHPVLYNVACTYAGLGEADLALDVLERTMPTASAYRWAWLAQDADFAPLRGHPRWEALMTRFGPDTAPPV